MFLTGRVEHGKVELSFLKSVAAAKANLQDATFSSICIYRMALPGFAFDFDYNEYFTGLDHKNAQKIFEGEIKPVSEREFRYTDSDVKLGMTYVYWVATGDLNPIGPLPAKVRDTEVWWPAKTIDTRLSGIAAKHPGLTEVEVVGRSSRNTPLKAIRVGRGKRCVALVGAVHAGESGPELIIPAIERLIEDDDALLDEVSVVAMPCLNADEREALVTGGTPWYLRRNHNGVDLNRNFPVDWDIADYSYGLDSSNPTAATYRGPFPGSEAETQAAIAWLKRKQPLALFSFHCLASICGEQFLGGQTPAGADQAKFRLPAELYLKGMNPAAPPGESVRLGATTQGSLPTWCAKELSIPAFDIEISFDRKKTAIEKCRVDKTDPALLAEYQEKHYNGIRNLLKSVATVKR